MKKVLIFHIDMNTAHYRADYLKRWLQILSDIGYNAILWEIENNVEWETCPECVSSDAFSKKEFRELLDFARSLKFENIPLFQTIGHCEYVMKSGKYNHLREIPEKRFGFDGIDDEALEKLLITSGQYCPSNSDVTVFLNQWIEEYIELFGNLRYFHIGADEAFLLGSCPECREYIKNNSLSKLFVNHIKKIYEPLLEKNITPLMWPDMLLKHYECINEVSKDVVMCDWNYYNSHLFDKKIWIWGKGFVDAYSLPESFRESFGAYIFPEKEGKPNYYYTTDYLKKNGFRVLCASSSSCYNEINVSMGECIFAPHQSIHPANAFDFTRKGVIDGNGAILTSWSIHLHPWELQMETICAAAFAYKNPDSEYLDFEKWYDANYLEGFYSEFKKAAHSYNPACMLSASTPMGFGIGNEKHCEDIEPDYIYNKLTSIDKNILQNEIERTNEYADRYRTAYDILTNIAKSINNTQKNFLDAWLLAADNMLLRLETADVLARSILKVGFENDNKDIIEKLLRENRKYKEMFVNTYLKMQKPERTEKIAGWVFDSMINALEKIL